MTEKILFVDDESHVLESIARQLRKRFTLKTALGAKEALDILKNDGPFAVIVTDMRMPGVDGVQLLSTVKELYPETVRLMLTGNADQETATEAVNKGQIFRFLTKPCPTPVLVTSLALALRQYRLVTAERELLDQTLKGSIKVLSELLSLANPVAFSSGYRIKNLVVEIAQSLELKNVWKYEVAALMSQIGCISLPTSILEKKHCGLNLDEDEKEMFNNHPNVGAALLENIPRLESVVGMIQVQLRRFDKFHDEDELDDEVTIGAQILRVAIDYDFLLSQQLNHVDILSTLRSSKGVYNPKILRYLKSIKPIDEQSNVNSVMVKDIIIGMVVEEDVIAKNGALLTSKGQEITWAVLQGLKNFAKKVGVKEPIRIRFESAATDDQESEMKE
jgi:response regulator RpfG family c-di-GMP phosphodiesterase